MKEKREGEERRRREGKKRRRRGRGKEKEKEKSKIVNGEEEKIEKNDWREVDDKYGRGGKRDRFEMARPQHLWCWKWTAWSPSYRQSEGGALSSTEMSQMFAEEPSVWRALGVHCVESTRPEGVKIES
jgi:hypothetical protein